MWNTYSGWHKQKVAFMWIEVLPTPTSIQSTTLSYHRLQGTPFPEKFKHSRVTAWVQSAILWHWYKLNMSWLVAINTLLVWRYTSTKQGVDVLHGFKGFNTLNMLSWLSFYLAVYLNGALFWLYKISFLLFAGTADYCDFDIGRTTNLKKEQFYVKYYRITGKDKRL